MTPSCHLCGLLDSLFPLDNLPLMGLLAMIASFRCCALKHYCPASCPFIHSATEGGPPAHPSSPALPPSSSVCNSPYQPAHAAPCDCPASLAVSPLTPAFSSLGFEAQFWCLLGGGDKLSPLCSQDSYFALTVFYLSPRPDVS